MKVCISLCILFQLFYYLETVFNILKSEDWQTTFKCAKLMWMFNKVILFPQAQNNKQFYHVKLCSNFIWQLRLWLGYIVAFIGNFASWIWWRAERSQEKLGHISFVKWKASFKMLLQINGFLSTACIIQTHKGKQPICTWLTPYIVLNADVSTISKDRHRRRDIFLIFRLLAELKISKLISCSIF